MIERSNQTGSVQNEPVSHLDFGGRVRIFFIWHLLNLLPNSSMIEK